MGTVLFIVAGFLLKFAFVGTITLLSGLERFRE